MAAVNIKRLIKHRSFGNFVTTAYQALF